MGSNSKCTCARMPNVKFMLRTLRQHHFQGFKTAMTYPAQCKTIRFQWGRAAHDCGSLSQFAFAAAGRAIIRCLEVHLLHRLGQHAVHTQVAAAWPCARLPFKLLELIRLPRLHLFTGCKLLRCHLASSGLDQALVYFGSRAPPSA